MNSVRWFCLAAIAFNLSACSQSSDFKVAKVSGQVTCEGKPVPYVAVFFQPKSSNAKNAIVGKQGIGYANDKGEFVIGTNDIADGAVIGENGVLVGAPVGESAPKVECNCLFSSRSTEPVTVVNVESGKSNHFEIQLKPGNQKELSRQEKALALERTRNSNE